MWFEIYKQMRILRMKNMLLITNLKLQILSMFFEQRLFQSVLTFSQNNFRTINLIFFSKFIKIVKNIAANTAYFTVAIFCISNLGEYFFFF